MSSRLDKLKSKLGRVFVQSSLCSWLCSTLKIQKDFSLGPLHHLLAALNLRCVGHPEARAIELKLTKRIVSN